MKKIIKAGLDNILSCKYWIVFFILIYSYSFFLGARGHSVEIFIEQGGLPNYSVDSLKIFKDLPWLEPLPVGPVKDEFLSGFNYVLNNLQLGFLIFIGGFFSLFIIPAYKILELGFLYGGISYELTKFSWYGIILILPHGILETLSIIVFATLPLNFYFRLWKNRKNIELKKSILCELKNLYSSMCILLLIILVASLIESVVSLRLYNLLARPLWKKGIITEKIEIESNNLIKVFYETTDEIKCKDTAQKLSYFGKGIIPLLKNEILKGSSSNSKLWCGVTLKVIDLEEAKNIILQAIEKNNITAEDKKLLQQIIKENSRKIVGK